MKLLTAKEIVRAEEYTTKNSTSDLVDLMDKAAALFANWVDKKLLRDNMRIAVVCGWGNNGGDGLSIARILKERNELVEVFYIDGGKKSKLCKQAYKRYEGKIKLVKTKKDLKGIDSFHIVVDAILGLGANRPFEKEMSAIIKHINIHAKHIMSVDLPSGMLSEGLTKHKTIVADETMTYTCPKLSFFTKENEERLGKWIIRDLNLDFPDSTISSYILTKQILKNKIVKRKRFSHKGTYGHSLLIGGEYGKAGSIILATKSCKIIGSGLVTTASTNENRVIVQSACLESMFLNMGEKTINNFNQSLERFDVIAIGPGLGQSAATIDGFVDFIKNYDRPLILDADALNIISRMQLLDSIPQGSILTPHPKEFDRLFGEHSDELSRVETQKVMSAKYNLYIILKDAYTSISSPEGYFYYNLTGNAGMAKGGSGDVLTGIITGFLAQSYSLLDSCLLSVYLHGYAGDLASKDIGEMSMQSLDIINYLPASIRALSL